MTPFALTPRRTLTTAAALALAVALLVLSTPAAGAATCKPGAYPGAGGTYKSLSVTKTTCSAGQKVANAFQACRLKNGKSGRCVKKVLGYACREQRTATPVQFTAKVTCANGKKKVTHTYVQNLP
jgi:hypothetical protein